MFDKFFIYAVIFVACVFFPPLIIPVVGLGIFAWFLSGFVKG